MKNQFRFCRSRQKVIVTHDSCQAISLFFPYFSSRSRIEPQFFFEGNRFRIKNGAPKRQSKQSLPTLQAQIGRLPMPYAPYPLQVFVRGDADCGHSLRVPEPYLSLGVHRNHTAGTPCGADIVPNTGWHSNHAPDGHTCRPHPRNLTLSSVESDACGVCRYLSGLTRIRSLD
jgi:hypothetical protein